MHSHCSEHTPAQSVDTSRVTSSNDITTVPHAGLEKIMIFNKKKSKKSDFFVLNQIFLI